MALNPVVSSRVESSPTAMHRTAGARLLASLLHPAPHDGDEDDDDDNDDKNNARP